MKYTCSTREREFELFSLPLVIAKYKDAYDEVTNFIPPKFSPDVFNLV